MPIGARATSRPNINAILNDDRSKEIKRIFNTVLNREPTKQEIMSMRNLHNSIILGIIEKERLDVIDNSEIGKLIIAAKTKQLVNGVSLVSTYNSQCGIATYTENLTKALKDSGFRVRVISETIRNRNELSDESIVDKCWSLHADDFDIRVLNSAINFGNKVVHIQHEFGLFRNNDKLMNLIYILKQAGFKIVITLHTIRTEKIFDNYYKGADIIVSHQEFGASRLYANGVNNVTVIRHGTEMPINIDKQVAISFVKNFIDLKDGDILAVSPGFICSNKMQLESITAVNLSKIPNLKYLLIGSTNRGPYDNTYLAKLKEQETDSAKVVDKFLSKEEMGMVLTAADFAIMGYEPSHYSTSGMSHLIISYCLPSVSSDSRMYEDLGDQLSLKFKYNNKFELIDKIKDISKNKYIRDGLRNNLINERNNTIWSEVAKKHVSVYNTLMSRT